MMKSTLKMLLALAVCWCTASAAMAQEPCDCPDDEPVLEYCVLDLEGGDLISVESTACELFCEGYVLFWEGPCDVEDPTGGGDGGDDPAGDCDCPEDEAPQEWCVFEPIFGFEFTVVATECELLCEGIFAYSDGACEGEGDWDPWPTECDCDYDVYEPVCVTFDDGTQCTFFNACEAECYGYTDYAEGECDYDWEEDWPTDCDCPEDEAAQDYCVINLWTGEFDVVNGTECELFCEGFLIVGEGDCEETDGGDGGGDEVDPCDCEGGEVAEWCVFDPIFGFEFTVVATECELLCEGIFAYSEGACEGEGDWDPWPTDCDCDYDVYEPVCVTLDDGTLCTFFNACEAECFGYTEYSEGECEYDWEEDWPTDCDCPEDEAAQDYCVINLWTGEFDVVYGTECELFCEGFLIVGEGDCEETGGGDEEPCDCEEGEVLEWCVFDAFWGDTYTVVATECELWCEGIFAYSEGACDDEGDWDPWPTDCDCDYDLYEPVCVTLDDGTLCTFFNACEAECFGYTEYSEGECEYDWEDWPTDCDCPEDEAIQDYCAINLWTGELEIVTGGECQLFCEGYIIIGDGDCEEIDNGGDGSGDEEVDPCDCPEEDPADFCAINLETGELEVVTGTLCELICEGFLPVGEGDCEGVDGDDDGGGIIPMAALEDWTEGFTISELGIYPNPVESVANVTFKSTEEGAMNIEIYSLTGQLLGAEQWTVNSGQVVQELDMSNLASGLYTVALTTADGNRTTVQVFKR